MQFSHKYFKVFLKKNKVIWLFFFRQLYNIVITLYLSSEKNPLIYASYVDDRVFCKIVKFFLFPPPQKVGTGAPISTIFF